MQEEQPASEGSDDEVRLLAHGTERRDRCSAADAMRTRRPSGRGGHGAYVRLTCGMLARHATLSLRSRSVCARRTPLTKARTAAVTRMRATPRAAPRQTPKAPWACRATPRQRPGRGARAATTTITRTHSSTTLVRAQPTKLGKHRGTRAQIEARSKSLLGPARVAVAPRWMRVCAAVAPPRRPLPPCFPSTLLVFFLPLPSPRFAVCVCRDHRSHRGIGQARDQVSRVLHQQGASPPRHGEASQQAARLSPTASARPNEARGPALPL